MIATSVISVSFTVCVHVKRVERRVERGEVNFFCNFMNQVRSCMGVMCAYAKIKTCLQKGSSFHVPILQPQDAAFFETQGKAVVIYDNVLEMHKI